MFVVPNSINIPQTSQVGKSIISLLDKDAAAATGFIYFDDGVSFESFTKFSKISFAYSYVNSKTGQLN